MTLKCIIVDDEPIARKVIKSHLENFENVEVVSECKNAIQAFEVLKTKNVDLMFLDIQMPQISGMDFLKNLSYRPAVIITTAYRDYAVESFDFDVIDYLLKPISLERFLKAINRYYEKYQPLKKTLGENEGEFIYVKENKITNKVVLDEIVYVESMREYITIYTQERTITVKSSLTKFCDNLPKEAFVRIHSSFVISMSQVKSFSTTKIILKTGQVLPISRSYKNMVMAQLNL